MKTGLACLAGSAVNMDTLKAFSLDQPKQAVSRTSLKTLQAIPTSCRQCPAGCGIIAHLDGDRCVQILGNPLHPINRGAICAKGIGGLNLVNDPERLLFPMKRIGRRGEGQWSKITWDEAYQEMISRLSVSDQNHPRQKVVIDKGEADPLLDRFIESLGVPSVIDRPSLRRLNLGLASWMMSGDAALIPDISRSRTILNFGANPYAHHDFFLGLARRMVEGRVNNGVKLLTFDVRMSETAARSDAWFPIKSGTDGMVALAIAHVIMKHNLADADFISNRTNTSLPELGRHLSAFPPEKAEDISGIKATDIEDIAVEFAKRTPSVAIAGGGVADHENGFQNARCVLLLNWLVGNLEKEGGLFYSRAPHPSPPLLTGVNLQNELKGALDLVSADSSVDVYFACLSNPAFSEIDCLTVRRYFQDENRVKFMAVMDTHLTETAALADLVLPAATYLESWGLEYAPSLDQTSVLNLNQPAVSLMSPAKVLRSPDFDVGKLIDPTFRPRGESKEIGDFCIEMAHRMGGEAARRFPFGNTLEFISQEVSQRPGLVAAGGLETMKRDGLWVEKSGSGSTEKRPGSLTLRKITVTSESLGGRNIPVFPVYTAVDSQTHKKKTEFILTTYKTNFFSKGTSNSKWLREIDHENRLWINSRVAAQNGIKNGDKVRISSASGSVISRVLVTERIHPDSVALAEGFGHTATGRIAKAEKFESQDRDTHLLWWSKAGQGVNPNEILGSHTDSTSGAYVSKDTLVRIEKI